MPPPTPEAQADAGPVLEPPAVDARRALPTGDVLRAAVFTVLALALALHGDWIPALVTALAAALFVVEAIVHRRRDDQLGRAFGRAVGRALASRRRFRP
jgi:hypothetical protein